MKWRLVIALGLIAGTMAFQGCGVGVISDKDQMDKSKALEAVAKAKAPEDSQKVER